LSVKMDCCHDEASILRLIGIGYRICEYRGFLISLIRAVKTATSNRSNRELELRRDWFAFYLRHQHYGTRRKKAENSKISRSVRRYFVCARIADVFRNARNETRLLRANLVRYLFCMVDMDHDGDALLVPTTK
jgi:hypothetical protein